MGGIDAERVIAVGFGESAPVASNNTVNGRLLNRRVVAEVRIPGNIAPPTRHGATAKPAKQAGEAYMADTFRGRNGRSISR